MESTAMAEHGKEMRKQILDKITWYMQTYGYPPTTRDICNMVHLGSTSSVNSHLQRMRDEGVLDFQDGQPRTITVPGYKYTKTD